jgi:uncharacterized protein
MHFLSLDPLYFIIIGPVFVFALIAQGLVKSSFKKYSQIRVQSGLTGGQAAERLLQSGGASDVTVTGVSGFLSDHYSPRHKKLGLSQDVMNNPTIAALGVAAHEVGHALQHSQGMGIMRVWQALAVPLSFISNASIWLIVLGSFVSIVLAEVGIFLFAGVVVFQLLTLPLEFNASKRAKEMLVAQGMITEEERKGVSRVLSSAALTYVAAAAVSIAWLLYFVIRLGLLRRR